LSDKGRATGLFNKRIYCIYMEKKKVLLITQEIEPYTEGTEMSALMSKLPKFLGDAGYELRVLMPRYSAVNERRHRLHEVVRLSGMNIIVDDDDYPLLIKVASLPNTRLQMYFLDNEEFFKRSTLYGTPEAPFEDNADRAAFFCKGAIEIVKKFGWSPDFVLCTGWMTALIPLYLRTAYRTEPLFANAQLVYGLFDMPYEQLSDRLLQKGAINNLGTKDLAAFSNPDGSTSMHRGATAFSDGVVVGSETFDASVDYLAGSGKLLAAPAPSADEFHTAVLETLKALAESTVEN
jgi:starch synthase